MTLTLFLQGFKGFRDDHGRIMGDSVNYQVPTIAESLHFYKDFKGFQLVMWIPINYQQANFAET